MTDTLVLQRPDDWHVHLRDDALLAAVVGDTAAQFARAIVMPNLQPPVVTVKQALAYRDRIRAVLPDGSDFQPLMTLYLTDATTPEQIEDAVGSGAITACKLYPAGATTHSDDGVTDVPALNPTLEAMQAGGLPLLVHGEVTDPEVDVFDREQVFMERILGPLLDRLPELKVVFEHITTSQAADFVRAGGDNLGATITAHHLLLNRNALFTGGLRPHHYCLPVIKRERHRQALLEAASSGDPRFFLGTDSAPHTRTAKESACGCAGIYSARAALELYAQAFEEAGMLDRLEGFASHFGADFYGLPRNGGRITLERRRWRIPETLPAGADELVPLAAGRTLEWKLSAPR